VSAHSDRQFSRQRFLSQRLATQAVKKVRSELPKHLRSAVSPRTSTVLDQALYHGLDKPIALAQVTPGVSKRILFTTDRSGKLVAPRTKLRGVARQEAAHLLGAEHPAIFAAKPQAAKGESPSRGAFLTSGFQVVRAKTLQENPRALNKHLLRKLGRQLRKK